MKLKKYQRNLLLLCALVICLSLQIRSEASAAWAKKGNTVTNGSVTYKFKNEKFVRTNRSGRVTKTIYKPKTLECNPKIVCFYNNTIVVEYFYMYDGMFGKYEGRTILYNVKTNKLRKIGTFHVIGRSGDYLLGCGIIGQYYRESAWKGETPSVDPMLENAIGPIYSLRISTGKKTKITSKGMDAAVSGKYFYYVEYAGQYQIVKRCKPNGSSRKKVASILWNYSWDIGKLGAHQMTVWKFDSDGSRKTIYF